MQLIFILFLSNDTSSYNFKFLDGMQVIDFAPSQLMIIEYHPMGIRGVHLGNMMTEEDVAKPPIEIYYDSHNKSTLHTLVVVYFTLQL